MMTLTQIYNELMDMKAKTIDKDRLKKLGEELKKIEDEIKRFEELSHKN